MLGYTRRALLTRIVPSFALIALLPACGQPDAPTTPIVNGQRATSPGRTSVAGTPTGSVATPTMSATPSPVPSTPVLPTPTPTLSAASPAFLGDAGCPTLYRPNLQPSDPYWHHVAGEAKAFSFNEKVRQLAQLIVIGTVRDILPAHWVTPDGRRPANPHAINDLLIVTPVRVEVEQVAKGTYSLPDIYLAAPGGRVGEDCASYQGSGPWPSFRYGERCLYFINPFDKSILGPVPADNRYRYFRAGYSYTVKPDGMITIGPEYDIMGGRVDDPPRTLTVDEVLREIAALLATPGATPTC